MPALPLPEESTNEIKLADWLEIYAILSPDRNSSKGDLERALNAASVLEPDGSDYEKIEEMCLVVFNELEERARAADSAYPFNINISTLELKPDTEIYIAYLFCLCLSYFGWSSERYKNIKIDPWLLFEELSALAAAKYLDGDVLNFGTSRGKTKKSMRSFKKAIDELCQKIGEGIGFRDQNTLDKKDDKVDLIAWKEFKDRKTSKLIMFGQCAGGNNWTKKVTELRPDAFWRQWMIESRVSPHLRSFYIPHRVERDSWDYHARLADIIFDRCRIAYWAFQNNEAVLRDNRYQDWYNHVLEPVKKQS